VARDGHRRLRGRPRSGLLRQSVREQADDAHVGARAAVTTTPISGANGWLASQTTDGNEDRVHLVRVDGADDHAIAGDLPGRTAQPDFAPDGRRLALDQLTSEDAVDQLYVGDADGTHLRLVARCRPPACLDRWEPAWSPDGRRLAISVAGGRLGDEGPTRFGLAVVDVATQSVRTVLEHRAADGQDHFARWSPDGRHRRRTARRRARYSVSKSTGDTCGS
jgi:Tol biopolymer transport system component